jgi:hypothetical protein
MPRTSHCRTPHTRSWRPSPRPPCLRQPRQRSSRPEAKPQPKRSHLTFANLHLPQGQVGRAGIGICGGNTPRVSPAQRFRWAVPRTSPPCVPPGGTTKPSSWLGLSPAKDTGEARKQSCQCLRRRGGVGYQGGGGSAGGGSAGGGSVREGGHTLRRWTPPAASGTTWSAGCTCLLVSCVMTHAPPTSHAAPAKILGQITPRASHNMCTSCAP